MPKDTNDESNAIFRGINLRDGEKGNFSATASEKGHDKFTVLLLLLC